MSPHKFTTPRVVYLGQAYRGQDDRTQRNEARLPGTSDRSANDRIGDRRVGVVARADAR